MYKKYFKRIIDIIMASILLIVLFPLFIFVGIASKITTGKILFKQKRDGLNKKSFNIYKFKTMIDGLEDKYEGIPKIMKMIRAVGLDELPQLINIIKGDMSFVGPRPFITGEELPIYPKDIFYTVRPGVTSLSSSKGRRYVSHEKRLEYDYEYIENTSLLLDIKIIFGTIKVLFKQNMRGESWKK